MDQDAAGLHVIEALHQAEQSGLAASRGADQSNALAGLDVQIERAEHFPPIRIAERDIVKDDVRASRDQCLSLRMVAELMGDQKGREGLGQAGHVLGHVHQGDRQVARGVQDGNSKRADQHHIAGGRRSALPQEDGPSEQADGQQHRDHGVKQAKSLEIEQAALPGLHLVANGLVEFCCARGRGRRRPAPKACWR